MTCHCHCPTIIPLCLRCSGLKFLAFHQAWPASPGPQTISRMPKAWVEAPLLPVESTCMGSLKDAANWFLKLLKDFSNLFKDTSLFNYQWSSIKINLIHLLTWCKITGCFDIAAQVLIHHEHPRFFCKTFPLPVLSVWHSRFQPTFSVWFSVSTAQAKSCA